MVKGLLGRKLGMTQLFLEDGTVEAVTAIQAGPCLVTQIKTNARDGYDAVQLGFGLAQRLSSAERGHLKRAGSSLRHLQEVQAEDIASLQVGQSIDVGIFHAGDLVDVVGVSKGKGFAGVVKRHHFAGGPKTHGQSDRHRGPGSVGASATPGRTIKGLRMAGHLGAKRATVRNLRVMATDPGRNLLLVRGAVPGACQSLLLVRRVRAGDGGQG